MHVYRKRNVMKREALPHAERILFNMENKSHETRSFQFPALLTKKQVQIKINLKVLSVNVSIVAHRINMFTIIGCDSCVTTTRQIGKVDMSYVKGYLLTAFCRGHV